MSNPNAARALIVVFSLVALLLVLVPVDTSDYRLLADSFNLGHVGLFFLLTAVLMRAVSRLRGMRFWPEFTCLMIVALLIAAATEILQHFTGRTASWHDLGLDLCGAAAALLFFNPKAKQLGLLPLSAMRLTTVAATIALMWTALVAVVDTAHMWRQFPVLLDASSQIQLSRWGEHQWKVEREPRAGNDSRLRLELPSGRYSGVALNHFYNDWRGYKNLVLELENPGTTPRFVTFVIQDNHFSYEHGRRGDRFRFGKQLQPGRHEIKIPIADIIKGPNKRALDISAVNEIGFHLVNVKTPVSLYLYRIYLE